VEVIATPQPVDLSCKSEPAYVICGPITAAKPSLEGPNTIAENDETFRIAYDGLLIECLPVDGI
jgi:hypothetical protein